MTPTPEPNWKKNLFSYCPSSSIAYNFTIKFRNITQPIQSKLANKIALSGLREMGAVTIKEKEKKTFKICAYLHLFKKHNCK